jgi:hypothetical protein
MHNHAGTGKRQHIPLSIMNELSETYYGLYFVYNMEYYTTLIAIYAVMQCSLQMPALSL